MCQLSKPSIFFPFSSPPKSLFACVAQYELISIAAIIIKRPEYDSNIEVPNMCVISLRISRNLPVYHGSLCIHLNLFEEYINDETAACKYPMC